MQSALKGASVVLGSWQQNCFRHRNLCDHLHKTDDLNSHCASHENIYFLQKIDFNISERQQEVHSKTLPEVHYEALRLKLHWSKLLDESKQRVNTGEHLVAEVHSQCFYYQWVKLLICNVKGATSSDELSLQFLSALLSFLLAYVSSSFWLAGNFSSTQLE